MRRAMEIGYDTAVLNSDSAAQLAGEPFDGIIGILPPDPEHPVRRFVATTGKPVVEFSLAYPENKEWGRYPEACASISKIAADHLRRLPVATFLFISGGSWWNHDARFEAFQHALKDDARPCRRFDISVYETDSVRQLTDFLETVPRPVAIFGSSDAYARVALDAALATGMSVPGDAYIMGFGNRELVSLVAPVPLTTIDIDYRAWAAGAVTLLHDMIEGRTAPGTVREFPPGELIARAGTGGESGGNALCVKALSRMREHIGEPLSLTALAKSLEVSKATLERAFAAGCRMSVARRYLELRMDEAKARLSAGEKSESVAGAVGFSSYRGFVKAFKKITGLAPGSYAKKFNRREAGS